MFNEGVSRKLPHKQTIPVNSPDPPDLPDSELASAGDQSRRIVMVKEAFEKPKPHDLNLPLV